MKTYIGDTGTQVILDCGLNLTAATASGTNSIVFTTLVGTFDQAGTWRLQARVTLPTGSWRGETATIAVAAAFG